MNTQFDRDNLVQNLPDAYAKGDGSNNKKLLDIEKYEMDQQRAAIYAVYDSLDLDKATGKSLDLYGEMFGQARGTATDEQYRVMIRSRINRRFAASDHDSIVLAICAAFGCDPSEVLLVEPEDSCSVRVDQLPFDKLNKSNIDAVTAVQIVSRLIPAGVQLESLNFAGTFEFGGTDMEYDESAGFGDVEQTIGGYLGLVADEAMSTLPV